MSFTREYQVHGFESFRDRTFRSRGISIAERLVEYSHEILEVDLDTNLKDRGNGRPECTTSDVLGQVFIPSATPGTESPEGRPIGSMWHGCPVRVTSSTSGPAPGESGVPGSSSARPIFDGSYAPDDRYVETSFSTFPDEPPPEVGTIGILYSATKEDGDPELIFIGPSKQKLLAPNLPPADFSRGTYVYDMESADEPSETYKAQLQSAWRVLVPKAGGWSNSVNSSGGENTFLAWQLGRAGDNRASFGLCVDDRDSSLSSSTTKRAMWGRFGKRAGGPMWVGERDGEKHVLESSVDGETVCSGHTSIYALYKMAISEQTEFERGDLFDGPMEFREEIYVRPAQLPFESRVHLRYDPEYIYPWVGAIRRGAWRWINENNVGTSIPPGPPPDPPPDQPPGSPEDPPPPPGEPPKDVPPKKGHPDAIIPNEPNQTTELKIDIYSKEWEEYLQSPLNHAFASNLLKASWSKIGAPDMRGIDYEISQSDLLYWNTRSPIVGREEAYGGYPDEITNPVYTQQPGYELSHFRSGTGPGGKILFQPELRLANFQEVIDGTVTHPKGYTDSTVSDVRSVLAPEVRLSFGYPGLDTGLLHDGWNLRKKYNEDTLILTRETGGTETEVGYFQDDFTHAFGANLRTTPNYSAAYGKEAWTFIKGERAYGIGSTGDEGDHQHSEYMLNGSLASGDASASLDIDGDDFTFPSEDSAWIFMAETSIRSSSTSALNADAIFVSRDEFAINVTAGTAALVGAVTNHFSRDEFTGGGAAISIAFSIASGNILRATVSKTGTDDVEVTCYLTATQCRNS